MSVKIGDVVFIRGYVEEIRKDTIIIRNRGGYFGTAREEVVESEEYNTDHGYMWICPKCGLTQHSDSKRCARCGHERID